MNKMKEVSFLHYYGGVEKYQKCFLTVFKFFVIVQMSSSNPLHLSEFALNLPDLLGLIQG